MTVPDLRLAIIIPVYNHEGAIRATLLSVLAYGYPVLLVDDHSSISCHRVLQALSEEFSAQVWLLTLSENGGKGAAVKAGLREVADQGFSHAIQLDADGQHDSERLPILVKMAHNYPQALITGHPEYDASVPRIRHLGRYLTHVWIWINTLSLAVRDSMCGFRVYPVKPVVALLAEESTGNRMEFDPEILVRWCWRGYAVINVPVRVHYPLDGVSHFGLVRDNVLISRMHARLFFGMLRRLPRLLYRKCYATG